MPKARHGASLIADARRRAESAASEASAPVGARLGKDALMLGLGPEFGLKIVPAPALPPEDATAGLAASKVGAVMGTGGSGAPPSALADTAAAKRAGELARFEDSARGQALLRRAMTERVIAPADEIAAPDAPVVVFADEAAWALACRRAAAAAREAARLGKGSAGARDARLARARRSSLGEANRRCVALDRTVWRGAARVAWGSAWERRFTPMLASVELPPLDLAAFAEEDDDADASAEGGAPRGLERHK